MVSCAVGAREKIPRKFAHSVGLFNLIVLPLLVCWCIGVCIDVDPSNATERAFISAARAKEHEDDTVNIPGSINAVSYTHLTLPTICSV